MPFVGMNREYPFRPKAIGDGCLLASAAASRYAGWNGSLTFAGVSVVSASLACRELSSRGAKIVAITRHSWSSAVLTWHARAGTADHDGDPVDFIASLN